MRPVHALLLGSVLLAGCQPQNPTPPQAATADAKANPLEGTVLETQGEALQKAKAVQDLVDQQAQHTKDELERMEQ